MLLVVLVGGVAALVLTEQPKLDDARTAVDTAWKPLRAPDQLPLRYQTLTGALSAFDAAGGADRDVSKDLHAALKRWDAALQRRRRRRAGDGRQRGRGPGHPAGRERARLAAAGGDKAVTDSLVKFAQTTPNPTLVAAYNHAVRDYEDERTGTLRSRSPRCSASTPARCSLIDSRRTRRPAPERASSG